jgi:hypothetical protein
MFADTLPGDGSSGYVAAAYLVFLAILLIYLAIMGVRISRMGRDLAELDDMVRERKAGEQQAPEQERQVV